MNVVRHQKAKPEWVMIRYKGRIYRVEKQPFENNHLAHERAWYIVTRWAVVAKGQQGQAKITADYERLVAESCRYINEKYLGMRYHEVPRAKGEEK